MKILTALEILNPVRSTEIILKACNQMSEEKFRMYQDDMLKRVRRFVMSDDRKFSESLEENEMVLYASACEGFRKSLQEAEQKKNTQKIIAAGPLAAVIAWWHLLDNVRSVAVVEEENG